MGLIREVQGVSASLNKQERARRERERLKILTENYKKEIEQNLFAELMTIYEQNDIEVADELAILQKENIIDKVYKIIINCHILKKSGDVKLVFLPSPKWDKRWKFEQKKEKVFLYNNFDILTDLNENYFKILKKVKNEIQQKEKIKNKKLLIELKKKIEQAMGINENKLFLSVTLRQKKYIDIITNEIATNKKEKDFLLNNYNSVLSQVLRLYAGDITLEKKMLKQEKEEQKTKRQKRLISGLITSYILTDISKTLPKTMNKKRKY